MRSKDKGYVPDEEIKIPPFYKLPPPLIKSLNWLYNFFFPWWIFYLAMAYISYLFIHINPVLLSSFDWRLLSLVWAKNIFFLLFSSLDNIKFFNTLKTVLPDPLVVENNQRPKGPFC